MIRRKGKDELHAAICFNYNLNHLDVVICEASVTQFYFQSNKILADSRTVGFSVCSPSRQTQRKAKHFIARHD